MRAIIVSAGKGTRLLPLTLKIPKCLVEVNGRAILDHQIAGLRAAGATEITVVGGYRAQQIRDHLAAQADPATRLVINPFWSVASSIGSVWAARDCMQGPFCLLNGDTIFDASVIAHALAAMRPGINLLVESTSAPEHDDMRVEVQEQRVVAVSKDLPAERTTHRSLGIILCSDDAGAGAYRQALQSVIEAPEGHNAFHHAVVDRLAHAEGVTAIANDSGLWCEIDRPQDIERWMRDHRGSAGARALA